MKINKCLKSITISLTVALTVFSGMSFSDDTELYVFESSARSGSRPQVLIIFDNSSSMTTWEWTDELYDRGETVDDGTKIFYSKGGVGVPKPTSTNYFQGAVNGCASSKEYLADYGMFTGFIRQYSFTGENGEWSELPDILGNNVSTLDCFEDFEDKNNLNFGNATGIGFGFPVDSLGSKDSPVLYTYINEGAEASDIDAAVETATLTEFGTGKSVSLYTERYVNWYHSPKNEVWKYRLDIAKRVIEDTVVATPGVDFGLAVFNGNYNSSQNGGRVLSGIKRLNTGEKVSLIDTINELGPDTWTPLCETLYESYLYFAGKSVRYGLQADGYLPERDTTIEKDGSYISPFNTMRCSNNAYVVYITDGEPNSDSDANYDIGQLDGYRPDDRERGSYMPALASVMNRKDVNSSIDGEQNVTTFTIGFSEGASSAAPILIKTANLGGGKYFAAKDATELQSALQEVFSDILEVNASFTSPSIASNNFDRTQTFDSVYYAMFLPNKGARWVGNVKKFKVQGNGDIVDKNGANAIGDDGNLKDSACSYWTPNSVCSAASGGGDGNDVLTGGVLHELQTTSINDRTIYGDFGNKGGLSEFSRNKAVIKAGSASALAAYMGISPSQINDYFDWIKGEDVDDDDNDNSTSDVRGDVFGDPLHSRPVAINFGTEGNPDIRIVLGTNHGFLHMFRDEGNTVSETWSFMPYELLPNIRELKANVPTGLHSVYGFDTPPVTFVQTKSSGEVEKAWLFAGMRRGGKSYYALDISDPDSPKMMWKVSADDPGMAELGQTWAEPVVTYIPGWPTGNTDYSKAKPVLIFGAGYSPSTKDSAAVGTDDSQGRGVFILDAETGALVHSFGPNNGSNVTQMPGIKDSIPNAVALLDSNGDKLTDRIYASDTGANVWRIDLPSANPKDRTRPWTAFKFADLGGNSVTSDRRFFVEPAVAQTVFTNIAEVDITVGGQTTSTTTYQSVPYDAVVIGSGHRPHPLDVKRSDYFFTLQDRNVVTRSFTGSGDSTIPDPITFNNLYDVTSGSPVTDADNIEFGTTLGWYYNFGAEGEKSLAAATIIEGRVFFTSYVPGQASDANQCLVSGMGRLYGFDLHRGTRSYTHEYLEMGERVPDTPQLVVPPNGSDDSYMYLIGIGAAGDKMEPVDCPAGSIDCPPPPPCAPGDNKCVGGALGVNRIYYHAN
ncbi:MULTISPECIES: pilus assembly protein [unclassified Shewanella]|uniref:pilus assembly protein n=1 Tax=unclassified Shewanella TaxID=196818 RepID=UPI001BC3A856|nr:MULTISPECIES: PilC/PilY family type IV pilus protein [unclassified Shewanella]GIU08971.1 type IV pili system adhesin PilY [Shewanella sp. MBTL60-112-B1]GIU28775.1 type IV pili system adhesin PilY [Shewanella sp. MBTL60-112-B2]